MVRRLERERINCTKNQVNGTTKTPKINLGRACLIWKLSTFPITFINAIPIKMSAKTKYTTFEIKIHICLRAPSDPPIQITAPEVQSGYKKSPTKKVINPSKTANQLLIWLNTWIARLDVCVWSWFTGSAAKERSFKRKNIPTKSEI